MWKCHRTWPLPWALSMGLYRRVREGMDSIFCSSFANKGGQQLFYFSWLSRVLTVL